MFDRDDSDEQRGCVAICPMVVRGVLTVGALTVDWDFAISITNPVCVNVFLGYFLHKYYT